MNRWVTKNVWLTVSGCIFVLYILAVFVIGVDKLCGGAEYGDCTQILNLLVESFFPLFPLFPLFLAAYFLREAVLQALVKFVVLFVPFIWVVMLIVPEYNSSLVPIDKGGVAIFFTGTLVVVSLIIMVIKSRSK